MSDLLQYRIQVTHPRSKEVLTCIGQGTTVPDALKDAAATITMQFRPKSDGKEREPAKMNVIGLDGMTVLRTLKEFESGITNG